jgi:uncharacterized protein (TIGR02996 family)
MVETSPEATALEAAVFAEPADEGPQLVLADLLLAADDPRGELIVLHNRETNGGLTEPEALERYLVLAAYYGFPQASPEPAGLPWTTSPYSVSYTVTHDARYFTVTYRRSTLSVFDGPRTVLERRLRTSRKDALTPTEAATVLRAIGDAIVAGTPLKSLRFPYTDDELPSYPGCALRVYALPDEFTKTRGIPRGQLGLAARDYDRWILVWRRLARALAPQAA